MIHGLVQLAANQGFYLHCWEKVFNIMIYKKPGCIELEKLRILHYFEADMNLMIGILFGRRAMHHINDNKLYHKGQYRRPGGECMDAVYTKTIAYHVSHFTKTSLGKFESDAEACFDRIVMAFVFSCFFSSRITINGNHNLRKNIKKHSSLCKDRLRYLNKVIQIYRRKPHNRTRTRLYRRSIGMLKNGVHPTYGHGKTHKGNVCVSTLR